MEIQCRTSESQLSSAEKVCTSCLPPISTLEDPYILEFPGRQPRWQRDVENTLWLELLGSFVAVKNLYMSKELALHIAPALYELVGTERQNTLENIFLEGLRPSGLLLEGIGMFIAARQLTKSSCSGFPLGQESGTEKLYVLVPYPLM